jgi:hypothetical protein
VIEIRDNPAGKGTLQVIALSGKRIFEGEFDFHAGEQRITLPVDRLGLEPGCYLVRISVGTGFTVQSLLLVEK